MNQNDPTAHLLDAAWKVNQPLTAMIELSTACNFSCGHCYNFDRSKPAPKYDEPPLSTSETKGLIDEMAEMGVMMLTFTGGEPGLRKDLPALVKHATGQGLYTGIKSNGSLLSSEKLAELAEAGIKKIEITLYGFSAETHDPFVGVKGSFEKVVSHIKIIRAQHPDIFLAINLAVLDHNVHEWHLKQNLQEQIQMPIHTTTACHVRHTKDDSSQEHRIPAPKRFDIIDKKTKEWKATSDNADPERFRCSCAKTSFAVNARGEVLPCIGVPWKAGSARENNLATIWQESTVFNRIRGLTEEDYEVCRSCHFQSKCSRRNSGAYTSSGDYTAPDPSAGEIVWSQYQDSGLPPPPCLSTSSKKVMSGP